MTLPGREWMRVLLIRGIKEVLSCYGWIAIEYDVKRTVFV